MTKPNGWISLHRKLIDSPIWDKPSDWIKIWIYLLLEVDHQTGKGFFVWKNIQQECEVSEKTLRMCLKFMEKEKMISREKLPRGIKIIVLNWFNYQNKIEGASKGASKGASEIGKEINNNAEFKDIENSNGRIKNEDRGRIHNTISTINNNKDCTDICTVYKDICTTTDNCISSSNLDHKILKQTDKKQISSSFLTPPSPPNPPSLPSPSLTMYENEVLTYYMSLFNIAKVENQDIFHIKNLFLVEKSWHPKKVVNVVKKRLKQVKDKNQSITLKELEKWMWGRTKGEKEAQNKKRMKEFNEMMDKLEKQWRV